MNLLHSYSFDDSLCIFTGSIASYLVIYFADQTANKVLGHYMSRLVNETLNPIGHLVQKV